MTARGYAVIIHWFFSQSWEIDNTQNINCNLRTASPPPPPYIVPKIKAVNDRQAIVCDWQRSKVIDYMNRQVDSTSCCDEDTQGKTNIHAKNYCLVDTTGNVRIRLPLIPSNKIQLSVQGSVVRKLDSAAKEHKKQ